jgi:hypothetical protein
MVRVWVGGVESSERGEAVTLRRVARRNDAEHEALTLKPRRTPSLKYVPDKSEPVET